MRTIIFTLLLLIIVTFGYSKAENRIHYSETLVYSYSANDTLGLNKSLENKKVWDLSGRLVKVFHYDSDSLMQTVNFKYNNEGDIIEKTYTFSDGQVKIFTWEYEYSEKGLLLDEIAYNTNKEILYKIGQTYNDQGDLLHQSAFIAQDTTLVLWTDIIINNGEKIENVRFIPEGNAYHKLNWKDQEKFITSEYVVRSLIPNINSDVVYNYHFIYDKAGKKTQSTYLIKNDTIERNFFSYDENGLVKNIHCVNREKEFKWDFYYDHNLRLVKIINNGNHQMSNKIYQAIYEDEKKTNSSSKITTIYVVKTMVEKFSNEILVETEELNMWDEITERIIYRPDGLVKKKVSYVLEEPNTIYEYVYK